MADDGCFQCLGVSVVGSVVACREGLFSFDDGLEGRHGNVEAVVEMGDLAMACSFATIHDCDYTAVAFFGVSLTRNTRV